MTNLSFFVHGIAFSQTLFLATLGFLFFKRSVAARILVGYALALMAFIITPILAQFELFWPLKVSIFAESILPVFFWYLAEALFYDRFEWRRYHVWGLSVVFLTVIIISVGPMDAGAYRSSYPWLVAANKAVDTILIGLGLKAVVAGWRHDMLGLRLKLRSFVMFAAGLCILGGISLDLYHVPYRDIAQAWTLVAMAAIALFLMGCNVFMVFYQDLLLPWNALRTGDSKRLEVNDEIDKTVETRLKQAMEGEKLFSREGLSLSELSKHIGLPDYRVRKFINKTLGFRNFNQYLSRYRIAEAKIQLADGGARDEKILSIAIGVGYGSLATFNRAFKEITGETPSEYRKKLLNS